MAALIRQIRQTVCPLSRAVFVQAARHGHGPTKPPPTDPVDEFKDFEKQTRYSVDGYYETITDKGNYVSPTEMEEKLADLRSDHRMEILETLRGNPDPFDQFIKTHRYYMDPAYGAKDTPIIVPSNTGQRLIGCVCEEDDTEIMWMMLVKGEKKPCSCGHWFMLDQLEGVSDSV